MFMKLTPEGYGLAKVPRNFFETIQLLFIFWLVFKANLQSQNTINGHEISK